MARNSRLYKDIILQSDLEETDFSVDFHIITTTKQQRLEYLKSPNIEIAYRSAAVEIQRRWRGYVARCKLFSAVNPSTSGTALYSSSLTQIDRMQDVASPEPQVREVKKGTKVAARYEEYLTKILKNPYISRANILGFEDFCAQLIITWWRKRHEFKMFRLTRSVLARERAAARIQRAWRKHIDMQVYKYYRDLINFKNQGDPAALLRCINPIESKLLDAAAGVHIRFRLAGEKFPPNIYYKIFTHRPIQDMCANSPKNYSRNKLNICIDTNNDFRELPTEDRSGWYRRQDNNGWRLVSDRFVHHNVTDPVTWRSSLKQYDYPHDKLQRQQDIAKRRKQRKIEWMRKMYRDGMLQAKTEDEETVKLIQGAASGMMKTVEQLGPNALEEWEVDELLDWTSNLNFDEYISGWKAVATSSNSEKIINNRQYLLNSGDDQYKMKLTMDYDSNLQSPNTPVSVNTLAVSPGET